MIKQHFRTSLRNLKNNKVYSLINIIGLSLGFTIVFLIFLWVKYETSYDQYHEYKDRIYRIQRDPFCSLAPSFVPLMEQDFPEMEHVVRVANAGKVMVKKEDITYVEENVYFVEHDIFDVFSFNMIYGNPENALVNPFSIVITKSTAKKFFGDKNPLGQTLIFDGEYLNTITGVIEDIPKNSHMPVNILTSYETLRQFNEEYFFGSSNFSDNVCETYTRLAQGSDPKKIEAKFPDFIDRYLPPFTNENGDEVRVSSYTNINLKKVTDIHLTSHTLNEIVPGGDIKYVRIFSLVAILVLLIACSNFINLATAQGLKRAKEIIVRRLNGSTRSNLIWQFILEYIPLVLISLVLAVIIIKFISPYYCNFIGIPSSYKIPLIQNIIFYSSVFIFTFITAILYPAISISSKKLFARFKNNSASLTLASVSNKKSIIRRGLVIFQFSISIVIMICFGMINRQMKFMKNTNLGYNKENVVIIPTTQIINEHWDEFKEKLKNYSGIKQVTITKFIPTDRLLDRPGLEIEVNGEWRENVNGIARNCVDYDYHKTFDMKIIAGRDFDSKILSDATEAAILNEKAVKQLGFENPEQAIGSLARWDFNSNKRGKIIGVVEDVHFESLHNEIPAMIHYMSNDVHNIAIRLVPGNVSASLDYIEDTWDNYHHGYPMQFSFLDEKVDAQYKSEKQMMVLFKYFGLLAVLIACLGLYGLARFSTETRVKEIGIRKTNGATQINILTLLSVDFTKNVLFAFIISGPIAWIFIDKWLSNFAFKTNISWMIFAVSGLIALLTALITVGAQSLKTARRNPVEALRYE